MAADTFAEFARQDGGRFTDWLRRSAEPHWTAAVGHRFTVELAADTLDERAFERYLIQDYAFIGSLVSLVGFAVGHAPTMPQKARLAGFLSVLTNEEDTYFQRSFEALGTSRPALDMAPCAPATRDLAELFAEAVSAMEYDSILSVLLPVEWVYLTWATAQRDKRPSRFFYDEWITLHNVEGFRAFVDWLRGELDRRGPSLSPEGQDRLRDMFARAVALEVRFFDSAYAGG